MVFYRQDNRLADCTNLAKAVEDALNGLAWKDDSQIDVLIVVRRVDKDNPRAVVSVGPSI